jgi:hypothetical protein
MAIIERHPAVEDYFVEITLRQVDARGGVADLFEDGRVILLKDYRLDVDYEAIGALAKSTASVADPAVRKTLKKMTAPMFFEAVPAGRTWGSLKFRKPEHQAIYEVLCRSDRKLFERAARALKHAHEELLRLFGICFPHYETFREVPSMRLTRTLFENLHWDNHAIDDNFHQARIFANLDSRPRIWHVGHAFPEWVRKHYDKYELGRFAGKDPNLLIDFITGEILGGTRKTWMDNEPRHRIAFEPGEVWLAESRVVSHQIYYGEAAMVYMWFVKLQSMADPAKAFNSRVDAVHKEMSERPRLKPALQSPH